MSVDPNPKPERLLDKPTFPYQPANDPAISGSYYLATKNLQSHEIGNFYHTDNKCQYEFDRRTGKVLFKPGCKPLYGDRQDREPHTLDFYPHYDQPFHHGLHHLHIYAQINPTAEVSKVHRETVKRDEEREKRDEEREKRKMVKNKVIEVLQGVAGSMCLVVVMFLLLGAVLKGCSTVVKTYHHINRPWYEKIFD